jgi:hypothetical protein
MDNLTIEEKIKILRLKFYNRKQLKLYAATSLKFEFIIDEKIKTASCTIYPKRIIKIGTPMIENSTPKQLLFLYLHEILHFLLNHFNHEFLKFKTNNSNFNDLPEELQIQVYFSLLNIAQDHIINTALKNDMALPTTEYNSLNGIIEAPTFVKPYIDNTFVGVANVTSDMVFQYYLDNFKSYDGDGEQGEGMINLKNGKSIDTEGLMDVQKTESSTPKSAQEKAEIQESIDEVLNLIRGLTNSGLYSPNGKSNVFDLIEKAIKVEFPWWVVLKSSLTSKYSSIASVSIKDDAALTAS